MELALSENIRAFRKERSLTQEQLSEALGVTPGAVYKWEAGLSVPELPVIVKLADFFDTSVDVLLGYKIRNNSMDAISDRLNTYIRNSDPAALPEAEKALKKYPNSFMVVHGGQAGGPPRPGAAGARQAAADAEHEPPDRGTDPLRSYGGSL